MATVAHVGLTSIDLVTLRRPAFSGMLWLKLRGCAVLLFCLLTLRYCQDKCCLLKVCTESTSCTKLRVMKISSGLDKLTLLLLTQAMGESFVIHLLKMLLWSKSLQLFHYRRHSFSCLLLLIWLVPTSACCDACTSTCVCLFLAEKLCCRLHK